jgi:hypothetical protein
MHSRFLFITCNVYVKHLLNDAFFIRKNDNRANVVAPNLNWFVILSWRCQATSEYARILSITTLSITILSITTLSIMTLSIMTLSITTLSIMTLSLTTLSITTLSTKTLSITTLRILKNDPQYKDTQYYTKKRDTIISCRLSLHRMSLWWMSWRSSETYVTKNIS